MNDQERGVLFNLVRDGLISRVELLLSFLGQQGKYSNNKAAQGKYREHAKWEVRYKQFTRPFVKIAVGCGGKNVFRCFPFIGRP